MAENFKWDDGHAFASVDLKWSIWSETPSVWQEHAPQTYAALVKGVEEGYLNEYGGSLTITSQPRKETRMGRVRITGATTNVVMRDEAEDGGPIEVVDTFETPDTLVELLASVDQCETQLLELIQGDREC
jgi:hypothetical protein